jgi:hypothetical protein
VAVSEAQQIKRPARAFERVPVSARSRTRSKRVRQAPSFELDYWVRHSEGFRVDAVAGRLGFVEEICVDTDDRVILHVRAGLLGRRILHVPASSVAFIVPRAQRLWLHSPIQIAASSAV